MPPMKSGPKKGSRNRAKKTRAEWYACCHTYRTEFSHLKPARFLDEYNSNNSNFTNTKSERDGLKRHLSQYDEGILTKDENSMRLRTPRFIEVEKKIVEYIRSERQQGTNSTHREFKAQAEEYANQLNITNFKASNGWLRNLLIRNKLLLKGPNAHDGEADEMGTAAREKDDVSSVGSWNTRHHANATSPRGHHNPRQDVNNDAQSPKANDNIKTNSGYSSNPKLEKLERKRDKYSWALRRRLQDGIERDDRICQKFQQQIDQLDEEILVLIGLDDDANADS